MHKSSTRGLRLEPDEQIDFVAGESVASRNSGQGVTIFKGQLRPTVEHSASFYELEHLFPTFGVQSPYRPAIWSGRFTTSRE